jgi:hypothetical protein
MKRLLPIAVVLAFVGACSPSADQPPANKADSAQAPQAAPAVPPLAGEWTVTQIDGQAPDQIWPMTATAADGRFIIHSECRQLSWTYRQDRNIVQFAPAAGKECGRVRSPAEHQADKAVKLANIAMFSDEGRAVELSGPGGRLAMTRR